MAEHIKVYARFAPFDISQDTQAVHFTAGEPGVIEFNERQYTFADAFDSGGNANHHCRPTFPAENALRTGIGYSWQMCGDAYVRPPALDLDYGTPNAKTFRCFR